MLVGLISFDRPSEALRHIILISSHLGPDTSCRSMNGQRLKSSNHAPGSVRHAEKRRTGTCRFADRIAQTSLGAYRSCVPQSFQQQHTCVATIVAHFASDGHLQVMGLGVGTKFLTESVLRADESNGPEAAGGYGCRVRDCHAEVLARRAFRRQLCLEMKRLVSRGASISESYSDSYRPILRRADGRYDLVQGVTLHFYSSSAPCGNATLKKFTKMEKEKFNEALGPNEWPLASHDPIPGHSLRLGQFALLVKKDKSADTREALDQVSDESISHKAKVWPANQSDDWCPPGTSIVTFRKGSLHTCSDKICRWNCLGLQGSLIASMLVSPLYVSTITVGRKLTVCICRRAVCCRAYGFGEATGKGRSITEEGKTAVEDSGVVMKSYTLHHPSVMGTGVYMDDAGKNKKLWVF